MPGYITVLYTGEDAKAALVEANASRVAVEELCKSVNLRGVDVKWIFENETMIDDRSNSPQLCHGDVFALVEDTSQGWLNPEPQYEGDQSFLIVCFTRRERVYVELFLVNAPNGYAALLDPNVWPIGMGVRAHQKRVDSSIRGEQIGEFDLTYKVYNLDGTEVDLKAAREEYAENQEWIHNTWREDEDL